MSFKKTNFDKNKGFKSELFSWTKPIIFKSSRKACQYSESFSMLLEVYVKRNGLLQSLARRFDDIVLSCRNSLLPLAPDFVSFAAILSNTTSTSDSRRLWKLRLGTYPSRWHPGSVVFALGCLVLWRHFFYCQRRQPFVFSASKTPDSDPWGRQPF